MVEGEADMQFQVFMRGRATGHAASRTADGEEDTWGVNAHPVGTFALGMPAYNTLRSRFERAGPNAAIACGLALSAF